jgi:8-oxo-dGTP pyrophosphatase MutT (NUDIX family)
MKSSLLTQMDSSWIERLEKRLAEPLPGLAAQLEMASAARMQGWAVREDHRPSGVLALLYPQDAAWHMVFMRRQDKGDPHGGQISFPGGRQDPEDADVVQTALREAQEELAIQPAQVRVLGQLTRLYIPHSNYMVYPTVGISLERPAFIPEEEEVAEVIESELAHFLQPYARQRTTIRDARGYFPDVPAFEVRGHYIWGATAMILNELLTALREAGAPASPGR